MSRSYRKNPRCKLENSQYYKNYSNRKIRQMHRQGDYTIPDGGAYRHVVCPWDICDVNCYDAGWEQYRQEYERSDCWVVYSTLYDSEDIEMKTLYRWWYKTHKGK